MSCFRNWVQDPCCKSGYIELNDEEAEPKEFESRKLPQFYATFIANIGAFSLGTALGWTSPALPNIEELGDLNNLKANSELATWIGAMTPLGCFFSGFVAGFLVGKIGRKWTMLAMALPFIAGWLTIGFAPTVPWVLAGRFLTGLCGGTFTLTVPVYTSEVAEDKVRGFLCGTMGLAINSGVLFIYILGSLVTWRTSSIISAAFPALFAIAMLFMPETQLYLFSKGRTQEAFKSLMWLRGANLHAEVEDEMKSIETSLKNSMESNSASFRDLMSPSVFKPGIICAILMIFQQYGGINGVTFYSVDIFKAAGTNINANLSAIILGIITVVVAVISMFLVDRLGRKLLLVVSELGLTISLLALGSYFYIKEDNQELAGSLGWLPLSSLILFVASFNFGMGPVPWVLMGELPPPNAKGFISSLTTALSWGLGFIVTKFFNEMTIALTTYGCYWFFSAFSFAGFIYCIFFIPETKGKSALEIQRYFQYKR